MWSGPGPPFGDGRLRPFPGPRSRASVVVVRSWAAGSVVAHSVIKLDSVVPGSPGRRVVKDGRFERSSARGLAVGGRSPGRGNRRRAGFGGAGRSRRGPGGGSAG